jgi:hypothetical protein
VPNRRQILQGSIAAVALFVPLRTAWAAVRGTVVAVVNTATNRKPGAEPAPLAAGASVEDGTEIQTGKESAVQLALAQGGTFIAGSRSAIAFADAAPLLMERGKFRYIAAGSESYGLDTPTLNVVQTAADFVVEVRDNGDTLCGVTRGAIVCTSKKRGTSARVGAGQSVVWAGGSFGGGVTDGVYRTGDPAVDDSMDAARAKYAPPPPPELPVPPEAPPIPPPQSPQ